MREGESQVQTLTPRVPPCSGPGCWAFAAFFGGRSSCPAALLQAVSPALAGQDQPIALATMSSFVGFPKPSQCLYEQSLLNPQLPHLSLPSVFGYNPSGADPFLISAALFLTEGSFFSGCQSSTKVQ